MGFLVFRTNNIPNHHARAGQEGTLDAVQIWVNCTLGDELLVSAFIPHAGEAPIELLGRCVMMKVPSMPFILTQFNAIYATIPDADKCAITLNKLKSIRSAVYSDPQRHYTHYLFVFPEGYKLQNVIFSSDERRVIPRFVKSVKIRETPNLPNNHINQIELRKYGALRNQAVMVFMVALKGSGSATVYNHATSAENNVNNQGKDLE